MVMAQSVSFILRARASRPPLPVYPFLLVYKSGGSPAPQKRAGKKQPPPIHDESYPRVRRAAGGGLFFFLVIRPPPGASRCPSRREVKSPAARPPVDLVHTLHH